MYNTKSKEMLYNFFILNKEKSYSANDLVNEFSSEIDKSTIYRQLIKLENKNMLRKTFNSNKNIYEYQYVNDSKDNLYLSCNKCGKTISTNCETTNSFIAHIFKSHGFNIDKNLSTIYGLCKECE